MSRCTTLQEYRNLFRSIEKKIENLFRNLILFPVERVGYRVRAESLSLSCSRTSVPRGKSRGFARTEFRQSHLLAAYLKTRDRSLSSRPKPRGNGNPTFPATTSPSDFSFEFLSIFPSSFAAFPTFLRVSAEYRFPGEENYLR